MIPANPTILRGAMVSNEDDRHMRQQQQLKQQHSVAPDLESGVVVGSTPPGTPRGSKHIKPACLKLPVAVWEGSAARAQSRDIAMRQAFLRKVYCILFLQILVTTGIAALCMYQPDLQGFLVDHYLAFVWGMLVPSVGLICLLFKYKQSHPTNMIILFLFTVFESFVVGAVCAAYKERNLGQSVLYAFIATCAVMILLTLYTLQSKRDFSQMGAGLFVGLFLMILWGLMISFFGWHLTFLYGLIGALLFCGFIIYDTKQIQEKYGYDEYCIAAIELYLDVINLFLYILTMFGSSD